MYFKIKGIDNLSNTERCLFFECDNIDFRFGKICLSKHGYGFEYLLSLYKKDFKNSHYEKLTDYIENELLHGRSNDTVIEVNNVIEVGDEDLYIERIIL